MFFKPLQCCGIRLQGQHIQTGPWPLPCWAQEQLVSGWGWAGLRTEK